MPKNYGNQRDIPSVDFLIENLDSNSIPRPLLSILVREELKKIRKTEKVPSRSEIIDLLNKKKSDLILSRLKPVINGTGVVIHTNLGRSPIDIPDATGGYLNLEFDLSNGKRGDRAIYVEKCLAALLDAQAGMFVNNCAAALMLILKILSPNKNKVIISRGELVQIGGGFRLPEILQSTGAELCEIGTTNQTTITDYEESIDSNTGLILKVHRSNFSMDGFVGSPKRKELGLLAKKKRIPLIEDLGSGVLHSYDCFAEPDLNPRRILKEGVDLVCFSGDKLMGGAQSGVIAGKKRLINFLKNQPLYRAFRCDKMVLTVMQDVLEKYLNKEVESLKINKIITEDLYLLKQRAQKIVSELNGLKLEFNIIPCTSTVGGGTSPKAKIKSIALQFSSNKLNAIQIATRMRNAELPIIGLIKGGKYCLDLRTIFPEQDKFLLSGIREIFN